MHIINLMLKRFFDICVSLFFIMFFTIVPVFIIVPVMIKFTSKGPVIFKQTRIGKNGKAFTMYKFRTMITEQYDANGNEIMSENRITKIGKLLRKTSLDELPQLFTNTFIFDLPLLITYLFFLICLRLRKYTVQL